MAEGNYGGNYESNGSPRHLAGGVRASSAYGTPHSDHRPHVEPTQPIAAPSAAPSKSKRYRYMDYLNVIACFAVVMLHCSQNVFLPDGSKTWTMALAIQSIFIFAVGVFFLISGANLLGYRDRYSTSTFFKKRVKRGFMPLVYGSILFYAIGCLQIPVGAMPSFDFSIADFFQRFLTNDICNIYWFFYTILMLYVMTPILSWACRDKKTVQYMIVVGVIVAFVLPTVYHYIPVAKDYVGLFTSLPMFTSAMVYYITGYYLAHQFEHKVPNWLLIVLALVSVATMFALEYSANMPPEAEFNKFFVSTGSIPCYVLSSALFLLGKNIEQGRRHSGKGQPATYPVVKKMSAASLGVYLVHLLLVDLLGGASTQMPLVMMILRPIFVYLVCVLVIMAGQALIAKVKPSKAKASKMKS